MKRLLTIKDVCTALSLSRATIYRRIKSCTFPGPLKDGSSARWTEDDVNVYVQRLERARNSAGR
ncbi:TPA: AlpA family phage regulatory protein [Klebsiella aerogenes]|nr:AlpA family phage regulatory protein [Klebsiella aerogenes]